MTYHCCGAGRIGARPEEHVAALLGGGGVVGDGSGARGGPAPARGRVGALLPPPARRRPGSPRARQRVRPAAQVALHVALQGRQLRRRPRRRRVYSANRKGVSSWAQGNRGRSRGQGPGLTPK